MQNTMIVRHHPPKGYAKAKPLNVQFKVEKKTEFDMLMDVVYRHAPQAAPDVLKALNYNYRAERRTMLGEDFDCYDESLLNQLTPLHSSVTSTTEDADDNKELPQTRVMFSEAIGEGPLDLRVTQMSPPKEAQPINYSRKDNKTYQTIKEIQTETVSSSHFGVRRDLTAETQKRFKKERIFPISVPNRTSMTNYPSLAPLTTVNHHCDQSRSQNAIVNKDLNGEVVFQNVYIICKQSDELKSTNDRMLSAGNISPFPVNTNVLDYHEHITNNVIKQSTAATGTDVDSSNIPAKVVKNLVDENEISEAAAKNKRPTRAPLKDHGDKSLNEIIDDINKRELSKRKMKRIKKQRMITAEVRKSMFQLLGVRLSRTLQAIKRSKFRSRQMRRKQRKPASCQALEENPAELLDAEDDIPTIDLTEPSQDPEEPALENCIVKTLTQFLKKAQERNAAKKTQIPDAEVDTDQLIELLPQEPASPQDNENEQNASDQESLEDIQLTIFKDAADRKCGSTLSGDEEDAEENNNYYNKQFSKEPSEQLAKVELYKNDFGQGLSTEEYMLINDPRRKSKNKWKGMNENAIVPNEELDLSREENIWKNNPRPYGKSKTVIRKSPRLAKSNAQTLNFAEPELSEDEAIKRCKRKLASSRKKRKVRTIFDSESDQEPTSLPKEPDKSSATTNQEQGEGHKTHKHKHSTKKKSTHNDRASSVEKKTVQEKNATEIENTPDDIIGSIISLTNTIPTAAPEETETATPKIQNVSNFVDYDTFLPKYLKKMQKNPWPNQTPRHQPDYNFPNQITNVTTPFVNKKRRTTDSFTKNDSKMVSTDPRQKRGQENNPAFGNTEWYQSLRDKEKDIERNTMIVKQILRQANSCDGNNREEPQTDEPIGQSVEERSKVYDFSDWSPPRCGSPLASFKKANRLSPTVDPPQTPPKRTGLKIRISRHNYTYTAEML